MNVQHPPQNAKTSLPLVVNGIAIAFSALWVGLLFFFAISFHADQSLKSAIDEELRLHGRRATGIMDDIMPQFSDEGSRSYEITYWFPLPTGPLFRGRMTVPDSAGFGGRQPVQVEYLERDPMINRPAGGTYKQGSNMPPWGQALFAGFMVAPGFLIFATAVRDAAKSSRRTASGLALFGLAAAAVTLSLGYVVAQARIRHMSVSQADTYTVQAGDYLSAGSKTRYHDRENVLVIQQGALTLNGRSYGPLPAHAHVWLKSDKVYVNGDLRGPLSP